MSVVADMGQLLPKLAMLMESKEKLLGVIILVAILTVTLVRWTIKVS